MARTTVEDCLDFVDNRFHLVLVAAKRAREIAAGLTGPEILTRSSARVHADTSVVSDEELFNEA